MIKAYILDDVDEFRFLLRQLLSEEAPEIEIAGEANNLEKGDLDLQKLDIQLLFLDIELKTGTGFDLVHRILSRGVLPFKIIFITGNGREEYAVEAMRCAALDYLNKPLDRHQLREAVQRAVTEIKSEQEMTEQMQYLVNMLSQTPQMTPFFFVQLQHGVTRKVKTEEIRYLESIAKGEMTKFMMADGKDLNAVHNIGYYKNLLALDRTFFPISQSQVVNLDYIEEYNARENTCKLTDGTALFPSNRGGQELRTYLKKQGRDLPNYKTEALLKMFARFFRGK